MKNHAGEITHGFARCGGVLAIITGSEALEPEQKAAELLASRIRKRCQLDLRLEVEGTARADAVLRGSSFCFLVGSPSRHRALARAMRELQARLPALPNSGKLHPEGYCLKTGRIQNKPRLLIAGTDERGTLYGVGAALRLMSYHPRRLDVPHIDVADRPRFWLRGSEVSAGGPRSGAIEQGRLRCQTKDELLEITEDLILLGANVFQGQEELLKPYGMMTYGGCAANALASFPAEWAAVPSTSLHVRVMSYFQKRFVCPSHPEARAALLEHYEKMFRDAPSYDFFTTCSGDVAGCNCDRCMPWGLTYIKLVHEMADILHRYHPECKLLATNQNLTNEGNQAMLDYLNQHHSGWLYALRYGPGGNEMDTYNRGPVNPKWFEYEGFGPSGNYLKHLHHELPHTTRIALFTDITHWILSQHGIPRPDVAMAAIYWRRAWNARPGALHAVATEVLHYAVGDMFYSEGMHDDFNKWFWYRMLWNPQQSAEQITQEYCRYWFGDEAREEMAQAIFLMEENLEKPLRGNRGIERAIRLLRSAWRRIPANLLRQDYRWRIIMQKALLDRYIQLWLERGDELKRRGSPLLEQAANSSEPKSKIEKALEILGSPQETEEMRIIMEEVRRLGEETNRIIGYREPAYFTARAYDVTEIGWWMEALKGAVASGDERMMRNAARMVVRYEDPGAGGIYERVGWPWGSKHLLEESNIVGFFPFTGPAKLGHYGMAYSWGRRDSHLSFVYDGLHPGAQYLLRLTTGFHCEGLEDAMAGGAFQSVEVNGEPVGEPIPLTLGKIKFFEFDLPQRASEKGNMTIVLRAQKGFPIAGLSEIWLMRKENVPWTAG